MRNHGLWFISFLRSAGGRVYIEQGSIVQQLHIPAVCQLLPSAPLCNEICCTGISAQTKLLLLNGKTPTPNAFSPTTRLGQLPQTD